MVETAPDLEIKSSVRNHDGSVLKPYPAPGRRIYGMLESTTASEDGTGIDNRVDGFDLTIDTATEAGPSPTGSLLVSYASCYVVALRIGARQRGVDDLGRVDIDAEADRDDDGDLTAIRFAIAVEGDLDDETLAAAVERANDLCHVHAALREDLRADVTIDSTD